MGLILSPPDISYFFSASREGAAGAGFFGSAAGFFGFRARRSPVTTGRFDTAVGGPAAITGAAAKTAVRRVLAEK